MSDSHSSPSTPSRQPDATGEPQAPGAFRVEVLARDEAQLVVAHGELDLASAPAMWESITAAAAQDRDRVELDMGGITFIDSSGINVLLKARELCDERGIQLSVTATSPAVQRLFEIAGLSAMLGRRGQT